MNLNSGFLFFITIYGRRLDPAVGTDIDLGPGLASNLSHLPRPSIPLFHLRILGNLNVSLLDFSILGVRLRIRR